ncbi:hypothetical protein A1O3_09335 [Capronia epimyces CBS 606.96]|uniref:Cyclohexanone monooxygenase n=1 Tax=Capronia epimyces CBS 606.96 TaxID=1182542 RepID=W9Y6X7_9EURO|nr:uncharacterized protein A1O3_09335 [Capronia epimyces CBS 606.96]EXJ78174.1 hypothetical protein A1O3_09335 [Capronia epimyces CBS 606.96]
MAASFALPDRGIDDHRPVKVICIGAGFSGLCASIQFPRKIKNLTLQIYEKNADIGGTWYENRYPGVACDLPSVSYQFTFENYTQWPEFYSAGQDIQSYIKRVAEKYGTHRYLKLRHEVVGAAWQDSEAKWSVQVKDLASGTTFTDSCDFLVVSTGILNAWQWPDIPGLMDFQGKLMHTANYDTSYDLKDKDVALIGAGSTGIQVLPTIQPLVKRLDHYMRSKTWIAPGGFAGAEALKRNPNGGNSRYTEQELAEFQKDPKKFEAYREYVEHLLNTVHTVAFSNSEASLQSTAIFSESMKQKLAKKPAVFDSLIPDFPPVCRRLTPGGGYLEAVCEDNVDFISTAIKRVHADGIETVDGRFRKVDAIITATGFDTTYSPRFPVTGANGVSLQKIWDDRFPEAYVSIFPEQMPNYFIFLGPNGTPPTGSAIVAIESQCQYMIEAITKCQREGYERIQVKPSALRQFSDFIDAYMPRTVYAKNCKSWFKRGQSSGRVVALFPGSSLALRELLKHPRWEDFDLTPLPESAINSFSWIGNGMTVGEILKTDTTPYLKNVEVLEPYDHDEAKADAKTNVDGTDTSATTATGKAGVDISVSALALAPTQA